MNARVMRPGDLEATLQARLQAATIRRRDARAVARKRPHGVRSAFGALVIAASAVVVGAAITIGVHDLDIFELDRNATNDAAAGEDWDNVFNGTDTAVASTFVEDAPPDSSIFTTGGSKDDLDVSSWRHTSGNVPDKDEITNAYAAAYDDGGNLVIYFGLDRFANNGDAQVGFWFFQDDIGLNADGTFDGVHQVGDVLVLSHFTNGGSISNIEVYQWVGSGGDTNGTLNHEATGAECGLAAGDGVCAIVNTGNTPSPWPYDPKSGANNIFPSGSFYEGGLDLASLGLDLGCGGSFLAETRSSTSISAQLKDFALGSFDLCGDITAVKYLDVNGNGADDDEPRLTGWTMNLYEDENGNGTVDAEDDLLDSGVTAGTDGSVTFTDLVEGDYIVCEVLQAGWVNTDPDASSLCKAIELTTAEEETVKFGNGEPDIEITKSAGQDTICEGQATQITYTFNVSNPGNVDLSNVSIIDDVLGDITADYEADHGGNTLAAGDSEEFTVDHTISATTTNIVTATGEFGPAAPADTDTATATVTAVACDIEITKDVNHDTICEGSDTELTYTFVVSNPGGVDLTSVSIIDDVLGDITADYEAAHGGNTLAAGDSQEFMVNHTLSATTTNIVTATGDALGVSTQDTATATVTAVVCTITLTKDVNDTEVCSGETVTYSYVVHNNSDTFNWTGDITDDNGTPGDLLDDFTVASGVMVGPGLDSATFTHDSVIGLGTVTNTATATGDFDDPATSTATDTDDATTTGINCGGGCTPGFWQGGFGASLWNEVDDPDWTANGGLGTNPFTHSTLFNDFFTDHSGLNGKTMLEVVSTGGGNQWYRKAARDVVAAYLNASFGIGYPFTTAQISQMWTDAVNAGDNSGFIQIHSDLGAANELGCTIGAPTLVSTSEAGTGGLVLAGLLAGGKLAHRRGRRRAN